MSDIQLLQKLSKRLVQLGFSRWDLIEKEKLLQGDPRCFGVIFRFILERFPTAVLHYMNHDLTFLMDSEDASLCTSMLHMLRHAFEYRASLNSLQMQKSQFFAAKAQIAVDSIALLQRQERKLVEPSSPNTNNHVGATYAAPVCCSRLSATVRPIDTSSTIDHRMEQLTARHRQLNRVVRL